MLNNLYYRYDELKEQALKPDATQDEINALGEWFNEFGGDFWNGEYYSVDEKRDIKIYPVFEEIDEDQFELIGYCFSESDFEDVLNYYREKKQC